MFLAPKILAEDEPPGCAALGKLEALEATFFYTKYQPQTWVQVVPHLGNEEIQTSSSRTCTWIQHEETSNHQGSERNSTRKSFIVTGDKATLLKSKYFLSLTSSSAISF